VNNGRTPPLSVGLRIKLLRTAQQIKQIELARLTGIPFWTLSRIECGWQEPSDAQISELAAALRVPPEALRAVRR
jgi:transcriptional regulator with XRE-family HTH domain